MDVIERYEELDNIISTLRMLIDETADVDDKNTFQEIVDDKLMEMQELESDYDEAIEAEERERDREYWNSVI